MIGNHREHGDFTQRAQSLCVLCACFVTSVVKEGMK